MSECKDLEDLQVSYMHWTMSQMSPAISEVRSIARLSGVSFAQESVWYLVVGEERAAENVAGRFEAGYQAAIRNLACRIQTLNKRVGEPNAWKR
jgi:hypothetical protein